MEIFSGSNPLKTARVKSKVCKLLCGHCLTVPPVVGLTAECGHCCGVAEVKCSPLQGAGLTPRGLPLLFVCAFHRFGYRLKGSEARMRISISLGPHAPPQRARARTMQATRTTARNKSRAVMRPPFQWRSIYHAKANAHAPL